MENSKTCSKRQYSQPSFLTSDANLDSTNNLVYRQIIIKTNQLYLIILILIFLFSFPSISNSESVTLYPLNFSGLVGSGWAGWSGDKDSGDVWVGDPAMHFPRRGFIEFYGAPTGDFISGSACRVEMAYLTLYVTDAAGTSSAFIFRDLNELTHPTVSHYTPIWNYTGSEIWGGITNGAHLGGQQGGVSVGSHIFGLDPSKVESMLRNIYGPSSDRIAIGILEDGDNGDEMIFSGYRLFRHPRWSIQSIEQDLYAPEYGWEFDQLDGFQRAALGHSFWEQWHLGSGGFYNDNGPD